MNDEDRAVRWLLEPMSFELRLQALKVLIRSAR